MSKRKLQVTAATNKRYEKEGRSTGEFEDHKSGLEIHDISSMGLSSRSRPMWSPPRTHNYFSLFEYRWLRYFDWQINVIDIWDQYLLPLDETIKIARNLRIKHPCDSQTKELIRLSNDMVITEQNQDLTKTIIAYDIKYAKDLNSFRTLEKFQIVKTFWKAKGVKYKILTENELPLAMVKNIEILRNYCSITDRVKISLSDFQCIAHLLADQLNSNSHEGHHLNSKGFTDPTLSLAERMHLFVDQPTMPHLIDVTNQSDKFHGVLPGTSLTIVYCALANRIWQCDMNIPFHEMAPFAIAEPAHNAIDNLKSIP